MQFPDHNLNVAVISWEYPPAPPRGTGIQTEGFVNQLVKHNWHVHVYTPQVALHAPKTKTGSQENYQIHRVPTYSHPQPKTNLEYLLPILSFNLLTLISLLSLPSFPIIVAQDWTGLPCCIQYKHKIPCHLVYVAQIEIPIRSISQSKINLPSDYLTQVLHDFSLLITPSPKLINHFERYFPRIKSILIPNGIDSTIFNPYRTSFQQDGNPPRIGTIGRLTKDKGILSIVNGFSKIAHKIPHNLDIIGDGPLFDEISDLITSKSLENRIRLCGQISHDKIPTYLRKWKIAVFASRKETFGYSVLEAICSSLPVITTPLPSLPELVHKGTAYILPLVPSEKDIANAILALLNDHELQGHIKKSLITFHKMFAWKVVGKKYSNVLRTLINLKSFSPTKISPRIENIPKDQALIHQLLVEISQDQLIHRKIQNHLQNDSASDEIQYIMNYFKCH